MKVYFISGLGADRRAFQKLRLPSHWQIRHLEWIPPKNRESLDEYARRLGQDIDTSSPFALVGLSFGGMIAAAMNQYLHPVTTVIISSIGCAQELPWYFKLAGKTGVHQLIPEFILENPGRLAHFLFGARSALDKTLLDAIISTTDPRFIRWSLNAILKWKNRSRPEGLVHIHGSHDRILPVRCTRADVIIPNGTHFMVWTKAAEVSKALAAAIESVGEGRSMQNP